MHTDVCYEAAKVEFKFFKLLGDFGEKMEDFGEDLMKFTVTTHGHKIILIKEMPKL